MFWKILWWTFWGILMIIGLFSLFDKNNSHTSEIQEIKNFAQNIVGDLTKIYKTNTRFNQEQYDFFLSTKNDFVTTSSALYNLYNTIDCKHGNYSFYGKCTDIKNDIEVYRNAIKDITNSLDHILIEEEMTEQWLKDITTWLKKAKATYSILINDMYGTCNTKCKIFIESYDKIIDDCERALKTEF